MPPPYDDDYRDIIEERQQASSPRSLDAADKLWDDGQAHKLLNQMHLEKKDRRVKRNAKRNELLEEQRYFSDIPDMRMIKEVIERKNLLKEKSPSPRQSPRLSPTNEGNDVYNVLEKVEAFKSPDGTKPKDKEDSGKTAVRLDSKTLKSYLQDIKSRSGKSSRRKPRRRKPRGTNPSRGKPRGRKSSRGG